MTAPYLKLLKEKIHILEPAHSGQVNLECKPLFSGAALYANGRICASLSRQGLALKLPKTVRQQMLDRVEGQGPSIPQAPVKGDYVLLPTGLENDTQMVKSLLELSIEFTAEEA